MFLGAWFLAVGIVIAVFEVFTAGMAVGHDWTEVVFNLLIAVLWIGFVAIQVRLLIDGARRAEKKRALKAFDELTATFKKTLEEVKDLVEEKDEENEHDKMLHDAIDGALVQVTGSSELEDGLTDEQMRKVEEVFHELVPDHYAKLDNIPEIGMSVAVNNKPFETDTKSTTKSKRTGTAVDAVKAQKKA